MIPYRAMLRWWFICMKAIPDTASSAVFHSEGEIKKTSASKGLPMSWSISRLKHQLVQGLLCILMILFSSGWVPRAHAEPSVATGNVTPEGAALGWRERNLSESIGEYLQWCGTTKLLVTGDAVKHGIRLVNSETGAIQTLISGVQHAVPECSPNGRYVLFYQEVSNELTTVFVYDRQTQEQTTLYDSKEAVPVLRGGIPTKNLLSPSGKYIVGPRTLSRRLRFPGGEELRVVSLTKPSGTKEGTSFHSLGWFRNSDKVLFVDAVRQLLVVQQVSGSAQQIFWFPFQQTGDHLLEALAAPSGSKVYLRTITEDDTETKLYVLAVEHANVKPQFVVKEVDAFDMFPDGTVVGSRTTERDREMFVIREQGQPIVIWRAALPVEPPWYPIHPHVSSDGQRIAFVHYPMQDQRVLTVLHRETTKHDATSQGRRN